MNKTWKIYLGVGITSKKFCVTYIEDFDKLKLAFPAIKQLSLFLSFNFLLEISRYLVKLLKMTHGVVKIAHFKFFPEFLPFSTTLKKHWRCTRINLLEFIKLAKYWAIDITNCSWTDKIWTTSDPQTAGSFRLDNV